MTDERVDTSVSPAVEGVKCIEPPCNAPSYCTIAGEPYCWLHKDWAFDRVLCAALKFGYQDRAAALARSRLRELNAP